MSLFAPAGSATAKASPKLASVDARIASMSLLGQIGRGELNMQVQVKELKGNWDRGFALHKHVLSSVYTGDDANGRPTFDTTRSDPGEALFQLKYRGDWNRVAPLATAVSIHLLPLFGAFGLIVPMPASNQRARQPVNEIAQELGRITGKPLFENLLIKASSEHGGQQLKDLSSKEEKVAALVGRFSINKAISNEGRWNVLLVDDLFDTGASMEAACAVLQSYPKIGQIFTVALTWK